MENQESTVTPNPLKTLSKSLIKLPSEKKIDGKFLLQSKGCENSHSRFCLALYAFPHQDDFSDHFATFTVDIGK